MPDQTDLDTLVTRSIGDIEAAKRYALDVLDPRLWEETGRVVTTAVPDEWVVEADAEEHEISLAHRSWQASAGEGSFSFELTIGGRGSDDDNDSSWLACFTGNCQLGSTFGFWLAQDLAGVSGWKKLLRDNADLVDTLRAAGIRYDDDDRRRLFVPVFVDASALAAAFESDDFDVALQPLAHAVKTISGAETQLRRLYDLARHVA